MLRYILYIILLSLSAGLWLAGCADGEFSGEESRELAEKFYQEGRRHIRQNRNDSALYCFAQAEGLMDGGTDTKQKIRIYSNLGLLLGINKLYSKALEYYYEALRLSKLTDDSLSIAYAHAEIGKTYALNHSEPDSDKALYYLDKALSIKPDDNYLTGYVYQCKGMYYHYTARNDSALYYMNLSMRYPAEGVNTAIRYSILGHVCLEMNGKLDTAEYCFQQALRSHHTFRLEANCYNALYTIAVQRGDSVKKNYYAGICLRNKDSIMQMENRMKEPILKVLNPDRQRQNRQRSSKLYWLLAGTLLSLSGCAILLIYVRRRFRKKETESKENEFALALENHRQEWAKRLQKAFQAQEVTPHLGKKHKVYVQRQCVELLHIDDWEVFSAFFNEEFNGFVDKIKRYYDRDLPQIRSTIQFCCLMLLEVSKENIEIILQYSHPDAYRKRCNLLNDRFTDKMNKEDLQTFLIRLMQK